MTGLLDLLHGRQPLKRALWIHAFLYGTLLNLAALFATLALVASGAPAWLAAAVFLLPLPYVALVTVGVWRSAGRPAVQPAGRRAARLAVVLWALAMLAL